MDFDDNDEQEEEMGLQDDAVYDSPTPPPPHHPPPPGNSSRFKAVGSPETPVTTSGSGGLMVVRTGGRPRYRECLKNQAVSIGGHAVDGCGEFLPAGPDRSIDALKCAACGCHRNFHRKETPDHALYPHAPPPLGYYRLPPPPVGFLHQRGPPPPPSQAPPLQLALPPPPQPPLQMREREGEEDYVGGGGGGGGRKRFRTKFTAEQKERMLGLAERIGWRIQRQDEEHVQRFCEETGVSRQVLKVWLHNNKHTLGKRHPHQDPPLPPSHHHDDD